MRIMLLDLPYNDVIAAISKGDLDTAADLFLAHMKPGFIEEHVAPMDAHEWVVLEFERLREQSPQAFVEGR
jgi:hypothetical protein